MDPRISALRLLRRIALQDLKQPPSIVQRYCQRSYRPLQPRATSPLRGIRSFSTSMSRGDKNGMPPELAKTTTVPFRIPKAPAKKATDRPSYEMTFTCKPCGTRSMHVISKHGYHQGSVLITCPECKNRHIISDHLNIFGDREVTIEDLMREKGHLVKKGTLSEDEDVEIWEDGTTTKREHVEENKGIPGEPRS